MINVYLFTYLFINGYKNPLVFKEKEYTLTSNLEEKPQQEISIYVTINTFIYLLIYIFINGCKTPLGYKEKAYILTSNLQNNYNKKQVYVLQ